MADVDPKIEPSGAEKPFGYLPPTLVHFTDDVLFSEARSGRRCRRKSSA